MGDGPGSDLKEFWVGVPLPARAEQEPILVLSGTKRFGTIRLTEDIPWVPIQTVVSLITSRAFGRPRRRKASSSSTEIATRAIVTVAPRARSRFARSWARDDGINRTDWPIHTTPGRAEYGTEVVCFVSERPKIRWATRTESDREAPATSYDRSIIESIRFSEESCGSTTDLYMEKLYYNFSPRSVKLFGDHFRNLDFGTRPLAC